MKYPSVTHRSEGSSACATLRRTRLVAPSAPIRKSDCNRDSRVESCQPFAVRSIRLMRFFRKVTPAFSASTRRYLPSSRRETTAKVTSGATLMEISSPKYIVTRSIGTRGRSELKISNPDSALVVMPPPQGFSHGACESTSVTECPRRARRIEAQVPAGPAPTTAICICF